MKKIAREIIVRKLKKKIRKLLKKNNLKIVAITGSLGKTSAKIATAKVLSEKYKVIYSEDSYNTEIGLPLSLFGLKTPIPIWNIISWRKIFKLINSQINNYPYDIAVLEMGADKPGDIAFFTEFIKPDIGVITAIAPVHTEKFKTSKNIFEEKWLLAKASKLVIYNQDFEILSKAGERLKNAFSYGLKGGDIRFDNIERSKEGFLKATLIITKKVYKVETKQVSKQGLYSLLVAASVANELKIKINAILEAISKIKPAKGRMNLLKGIKNSLIVDDSYNSSPQAAIDALSTLSEFPGRKIAVLGNMNELGNFSARGHRLVGEYASEIVDSLLVIGEDAKKYLASSANKKGLDKSKIATFNNPYSAGKFLSTKIRKGDIILVKGSQNGVFSEEVIKIILSRKINPVQVLVRQSKSWLKKKKKSFKTYNE